MVPPGGFAEVITVGGPGIMGVGRNLYQSPHNRGLETGNPVVMPWRNTPRATVAATATRDEAERFTAGQVMG
ncbi:MAG: hypothetical protein ACRDNS_09380 [Trebonia sp.]